MTLAMIVGTVALIGGVVAMTMIDGPGLVDYRASALSRGRMGSRAESGCSIAPTRPLKLLSNVLSRRAGTMVPA